MANFNWPINPTTFNAGPIQFEIDGVPTVVSTDTGTPADSNPLPVIALGPDGLPVDYATQSKQDDQIVQETAIAASVDSIDTKTPALVGGSVPVVGPLTDTQLRATAVPVSGPLTDTELRATPVPVSGTVTADQGAANATPWNVAVSNFPATQPVSGTVDVSNFPATQPISAAALPLPSGASTEAKQDTQITALGTLATEATLSAQSAKLPATLGQKTSANSLAVVLASDQTPLPAPAVPGALTVKQAAVSFGISAVRLTTDGSAPSSTRRKLQFIIEPPAGDVNYFMGSNSVTSSGGTRGPRLYPGTLYTYDNDSNDYYIVSDTATQTVFILEDE